MGADTLIIETEKREATLHLSRPHSLVELWAMFTDLSARDRLRGLRIVAATLANGSGVARVILA